MSTLRESYLAGRAAQQPAAVPVQKKHSYRPPPPPDGTAVFVGKSVRIVSASGQEFTGTLEVANVYTLGLRTENGPVVLFKGALLSIESVAE
jgi:hypothetical protein